MPITLLDGIVVGFTLVSAILAMVRGFSREVLSIASWVVSAIAAFFLYPSVLPYVQPYISNSMLAMLAAAAVIFFVVLIIMTIVTMKMADFIIDSRVGPLDRTLGFVYGAARGILVVAVAFLFYSWLVGSNQPTWVVEAKSRPLLESIGDWLEGVLPDDPNNTLLDRLTGDDAPEQPAAPEAPANE
jgi:membrane protein required for colicin V production